MLVTEYDLLRHRHYALLTEREKVFLSAYIESGGDTLGSLRLSYKYNDPKYEKKAFRKILNRPTVREFMEWIDQEKEPLPDKDAIVRVVWNATKKAEKPWDTFRGSQILSDLLDLGVSPPEPDPKEIRRAKAEEIKQARLAMKPR